MFSIIKQNSVNYFTFLQFEDLLLGINFLLYPYRNVSMVLFLEIKEN